jgi:hypothetical protein
MHLNSGNLPHELDDAAAHLEALGNPTRLKIYRTLIRAGAAGLPVGRLQDKLNCSHDPQGDARPGADHRRLQADRRLLIVRTAPFFQGTSDAMDIELSDLLKQFNLMLAVQSCLQKYFRSRLTQIKSITRAVSPHSRGVSRSSRTRGGMRWTRQRRAREVIAGRVERSVSDRTAC